MSRTVSFMNLVLMFQLYNDAVIVEDEIRTKIIQVEEIAPGRHSKHHFDSIK